MPINLQHDVKQGILALLVPEVHALFDTLHQADVKTFHEPSLSGLLLFAHSHCRKEFCQGVVGLDWVRNSCTA